MKHIIKIFLATILVFSFNSCEDSNAVVDQVVAETEAGQKECTGRSDSPLTPERRKNQMMLGSCWM